MYNRSLAPSSSFLPSEDIRRYDADTFLVFLSGNGVVFSEPASDDWYRATRPLYSLQDARVNDSDMFFYGFEEAASPLACVQQFQFCHTSLPENNRCGPLASLPDSIDGVLSIATSNEMKTQLSWVSHQVGTTSIQDPIVVLGSQSLVSQRGLAAGTQGPIEADQWQLDVTHWWATYLAHIQSSFIDGVVGPTDERLQKYTQTQLLSEQDNTTYRNLCQNQVCIAFRPCIPAV